MRQKKILMPKLKIPQLKKRQTSFTKYNKKRQPNSPAIKDFHNSAIKSNFQWFSNRSSSKSPSQKFVLSFKKRRDLQKSQKKELSLLKQIKNLLKEVQQIYEYLKRQIQDFTHYSTHIAYCIQKNFESSLGQTQDYQKSFQDLKKFETHKKIEPLDLSNLNQSTNIGSLKNCEKSFCFENQRPFKDKEREKSPMSEGVVSRRKFEFNPRVDVSHKFSKINSTISKLKGLISEK